jgi:hypothetical protein
MEKLKMFVAILTAITGFLFVIYKYLELFLMRH